MKIIINWWKDVSIAKKLYLVVGVMAVLISLELLTLRFAMRKLSAVRAFVGGEALWSKAQKNAAFSLQKYGITRDEKDYQAYLNYLKIPEGDHQARLELEKENPDYEKIRQGFLAGDIHEADITPMVDLLRGFYWISYLKRAIGFWEAADEKLGHFKETGTLYHELLSSNSTDKKRIAELMQRASQLNEELTFIESDFSKALGEGSRWLEYVVVSLLFLAVLMVETIGLTLTVLTSRSISKGLANLSEAAQKMGQGDFSHTLRVQSKDEIGRLTQSVNNMGAMLEKSYRGLESLVQERTAELTAMATENARLYEEAKEAVQVRDEFLSIASHELRTPLTSLQLHLEILPRYLNKLKFVDPEGLEKLKEMLHVSERQSFRLSGLIEQLMDITRLRLGRLQLNFEECDLSTIAKEAVLHLEREAKRANCLITLHAETPVRGVFDPGRAGQLVTNLVSNAIKYGAGKPIEVTICMSNQTAVIVVQDQGFGIARDQQARIFERFERVVHDKSISGLGLGLYISRQIVESHGGTISVQSDLGIGAIFKIELPLYQPAKSA